MAGGHPRAGRGRCWGGGWRRLLLAALCAGAAGLQQQQQQRARRGRLGVGGADWGALFTAASSRHSFVGHDRDAFNKWNTHRGHRRAAVPRRASAAVEQIEVLYDGLCRVCLTNKALLESNDEKGKLRFVNIADDDYDSSDHEGIEYEDAMNELHIILPEGRIIKGTAAVLAAYESVGLGWAVGILGSPVLRWLTDAVYRFLSENRQAISEWLPGGEDLRKQLLSARFLQKGVAEGEGCNEDDDDDIEEDCTVSEEKLEGAPL